MRPRVTVMGGVQVDVVVTPVQELPPPGETLLVDAMGVRVGGAGANAALALVDAGVRPRLLGCLGDDRLGHWMAEQLDVFGLAGDLHLQAGAATGLTVACEAPGRDRTFLTFLGVNASWDGEMLPADAGKTENLLVCDYFCAPAMRGAPTRELLGRARAAGARTFFDTAWDPGGWDAGTRREVLDVLPSVDVFLPNEAEARSLTDEADAAVAARRLQKTSGGWVIVKLGARGCLAAGPSGAELAVAAEPVEVLDSTGAGDAFNAGLIAALARGESWTVALGEATALAARILARPPDDRHLPPASGPLRT